MINKPIDQIEMEDIENLKENEVSENTTLEYKGNLNITTTEEKKEFLADISAFANASGGDIVFGIQEKKDKNKKNTGIPEKITGFLIDNKDELILKLEQTIQNNIEPSLKVQYSEPIKVSNSNYVLVIRIRKSWLSPHMITFKGRENTKFYIRDHNRKHPMFCDEIRSAFLMSENLSERIKQFKMERIAKILTDETPIPIGPGAKIILHILPISAFDYKKKIDFLQNIEPFEINNELCPIYHSIRDHRYNIDGLLTNSMFLDNMELEYCYAYLQLFRNGVIETVDAGILKYDSIPSESFEKELISGIDSYFNLLKKFDLVPPIIIFVTLTGVKGKTLGVNPRRTNSRGYPIDRDILYLPERLVENLDLKAEELLHPIFDAMWQACGFKNCLNYNEENEWTP